MTTPEGQSQVDTTQQQQPPWGEDFDADKAWKLIQGLRADKDKLNARPTLDDATRAKLDEFDKLKAASQTELEKSQGEVTRWQSDAEKWRSAAVASTVKALAATEFADPDDAVRNLDAAKYLDAGGTIDEKSIAADLADLLTAKPHYRREASATAATPRAPRPNTAQGSGSGKSVSDPATEFAAIMQTALQRQ